MLLNPTIEPTDRSMPAEIITMVIPMDTTPMIATWRTRFHRLLTVRKLGEAKEKMTKKASRIRMRIPSAKQTVQFQEQEASTPDWDHDADGFYTPTWSPNLDNLIH